MLSNVFELEMKVRDYECDMQGVVNNAIYQNYLEHTRHEFLQSLGEDFDKWTQDGVFPMVSKATIEYKRSLRSGDKFVVTLNIERKGIKYIFHQNIYRLPDYELCLKGEIEIVTLVGGRLTRGEEFRSLFGPYLLNAKEELKQIEVEPEVV